MNTLKVAVVMGGSSGTGALMAHGFV
jgi:hypothetical protein